MSSATTCAERARARPRRAWRSSSDELVDRGSAAPSPRGARAGPLGRRPLRAKPRVPPRSCSATCSRCAVGCGRGLARRARSTRMRVFAAALARPGRSPGALQRRRARPGTRARAADAAGDGLAVFPETGYAVAARHGRSGSRSTAARPRPSVPACARPRRRALVPALGRRPSGGRRPRARSPTSRAPTGDWFRSTRGALDDRARRAGPVRALGRVPSGAAARARRSSRPTRSRPRSPRTGSRVRRRLTLGADGLEVDDELDGSGEIEVELEPAARRRGSRSSSSADLPITSERRLAERADARCARRSASSVREAGSAPGPARLADPLRP